MSSSGFPPRRAGAGRGWSALAAGAALGLAAAGAGAILRRMRLHPAIRQAGSLSEADPGAGSGDDGEAVTAVKDAREPLPGWKEGLPGGGSARAVEVIPLDAPVGSPRRTWIVHNGPEWQGLPGELVVPPEDPRRQQGTAAL